jgi:predicted TIM-barrel fold metal-dependent hydrolase
MLTRREALAGALAGAFAARRTGFAKASQPATPVNFDVPADACDCHTHIFGPAEKFPFAPGRTYTPEPATPEEMTALHRALHIDRVVIVTPSVYGTDNSATLWGMKARGRSARGVAVIDERTPEAELDAMEKAGIHGVRVNLATAGPTEPSVGRQKFQAALNRLKPRGWHIQLYAGPPVVAAVKDMVLNSPLTVVFDHFGGMLAALGTGQPGFADLVDMLRSGKAYVKISGAYRSSERGPDFPDVAPLAKALIAANPDRVLWGTDWPHVDTAARPGRRPTDIAPLLAIDDGRLLNQLALWAPDPAIRKKILVDNPARIYRF